MVCRCHCMVSASICNASCRSVSELLCIYSSDYSTLDFLFLEKLRVIRSFEFIDNHRGYTWFCGYEYVKRAWASTLYKCYAEWRSAARRVHNRCVKQKNDAMLRMVHNEQERVIHNKNAVMDAIEKRWKKWWALQGSIKRTRVKRKRTMKT